MLMSLFLNENLFEGWIRIKRVIELFPTKIERERVIKL